MHPPYCLLLFRHCIEPKNIGTSKLSPFTIFPFVLPLTHYHTMLHFDALKIYSCGKHCEKRRNCLLRLVSPFLTMFSTLYGSHFVFKMHFKMSSAICFNLDQSEILLSGNGLIIEEKIPIGFHWGEVVPCMLLIAKKKIFVSRLYWVSFISFREFFVLWISTWLKATGCFINWKF